jgi:hypothetical protein
MCFRNILTYQCGCSVQWDSCPLGEPPGECKIGYEEWRQRKECCYDYACCQNQYIQPCVSRAEECRKRTATERDWAAKGSVLIAQQTQAEAVLQKIRTEHDSDGNKGPCLDKRRNSEPHPPPTRRYFKGHSKIGSRSTSASGDN